MNARTIIAIGILGAIIIPLYYVLLDMLCLIGHVGNLGGIMWLLYGPIVLVGLAASILLIPADLRSAFSAMVFIIILFVAVVAAKDYKKEANKEKQIKAQYLRYRR